MGMTNIENNFMVSQNVGNAAGSKGGSAYISIQNHVRAKREELSEEVESTEEGVVEEGEEEREEEEREEHGHGHKHGVGGHHGRNQTIS
jgi:hypothetical protein